MRRRRVSPGLAVVGVMLMVITGCGRDGRELAQPQDWQTTTTRPSPPTSSPDMESGVTGLTLTSPDFEPGGELPISATCAGANTFPNLEWGAVDPDAAELVVTLADQTDPDVPILMWLLANISPDVTGLQSGVKPEGSVESTDDYGITGFGEPCLDTYSQGQRDLQWKVHVLAEPSGIATGDPGNEAWATVKNLAVDSASVLSRRFNSGG